METFEHAGLKIKVEYDDLCESPREAMDNIGTIVYFSNRYDFPDQTTSMSQEEYLADLMSEREYDAKGKFINPEKVSKENLQRYIEKHYVVLPVYQYSRSGTSVSTKPFGCPWDSGKAGFIYAELNDSSEKEEVTRALVGEVETLNQYINGDIWGFTVSDSAGDVLDSCWGFYGMAAAKEAAKKAAEECKKQRIETLTLSYSI